ncbi:MAG: winged helix DNA-binding domain-containing protein [Actinocrinis sp.]
MEETLSVRALNRATLARQHLLERADRGAEEMVARLVGLQSQLPSPPYIGVWTRSTAFELETLTRLLFDRTIVRSTMMRYTQHLIGATDYQWLRPTLQPMLDRAQQSFFGRLTKGMDLAELAEYGRELISGRELTLVELRTLLAERWPDRNPTALGYSVQYMVPLVHVPPTGTWRKGGAVTLALAEQWLGRPLGEPDLAQMVRRYLAAFGPASVKDVQAWSALRGLADTVERLRPTLAVFRDASGEELFDLPDAARPDPQTPAPPRFLPDYDNLIVAHADRSRVITEEQRKVVSSGAGGRTRTRPGQHGAVAATLLVDGVVRATWRIERVKKESALVIEPFSPLSDAEKAEVRAEGEKLLAFAAEGTAGQGIEFI